MDQSQPLLGIYSGLMKLNLGMANTYLGGVRRMRQSQLDLINASGQQVETLSQQVENLEDFGALNTMHAMLLGGCVARTSGYWSKLAKDMAALQMDMSGTLQDSSAKAAEGLRQQWEQMQSTVSQNMRGLFQPAKDWAARVASVAASDSGSAIRSA